MNPRKDKKPRWAHTPAVPKEDVVTLLKLISEELGPTPEITIAALRVAWEPLLTNQSSLQDALADRTGEMHAVAAPKWTQMKIAPPSSSSTSASAR
jgi:hypothetical protein